MKKYTPYLFKTALVAVIIAISLVSCEDGTIDGPTDARDNFTGSWSCVENAGQPSETSFPVTITKDVNNSERILIGNFNNLGGSVKPYGIVNGTALSIPSQSVSGYTVSGTGTYSASSGNVSLNYTVNDGISSENYTATLSQ
jgi:hypothetical protein